MISGVNTSLVPNHKLIIFFAGLYLTLAPAFLLGVSHCDGYQHLPDDDEPTESFIQGKIDLKLLGKEPSYVDARKYGRKVEQALTANGYVVEDFLAMGGFSLNYIVRDRAGKRRVLKVFLPKDPIFEKERQEILFHELSIMNNRLHASDPKRFLHTTYRSIQDADQTIRFLEMDLIPSHPGSAKAAPDLHTLLRDSPSYFTPERKNKIIEQIRGLVRTAHDNGIWHLDLKPGNFLISRDAQGEPVVHLIDWGVASTSKERSPVDVPGNVFGTYGYISPERLRDYSPATAESDVFALRMVEWHVRNASNQVSPALVYRKIFPRKSSNSNLGDTELLPSKVPVRDEPLEWTHLTDPRLSTAGRPGKSLADASGFKEGFNQPALALDDKGSDIQRNTALAEWSRTPKTIAARDALIADAKKLSPEKFVEALGRNLMKEDSVTPPAGFLGKTYRLNAALEILSSHVLVDKLASSLKLSDIELEEVGSAVAYLYLKHEKSRLGNEDVGYLDPAPQLLYDGFIDRYESAARSRSLAGWNDLKLRARQQVLKEQKAEIAQQALQYNPNAYVDEETGVRPPKKPKP